MKITLLFAACLVIVAPAVAAEPPSAKNAPAPAAPVTSRSAKAVLQEYVAAWNRHDPAGLDLLLGPDSMHEDIPAGFRGKGPDRLPSRQWRPPVGR